MPGVERLGLGAVRRLAGEDGARGCGRDRRPGRHARRDRALRGARLQGPHPALQAHLGRARCRSRQLQPAAFRPALGAGRRSRHAGDIPCQHRARSARLAGQWRGGHQLCDPFALADHRAGGQSLRLGRAGAVPEDPLRHHRGRHRLGALAARRYGRSLPQAPYVGAPEAAGPAVGLLPRAWLRHLPGRPGGPGAREGLGPRRQFHVGERLSPP